MAADVEDDDAALPVVDPVLLGLAALDGVFLTGTSELSLELVSTVPLINHPSSVLLAPAGGVWGPKVPFFNPPLRLVGWLVLPRTQYGDLYGVPAV
jgi:hypothetical protein